MTYIVWRYIKLKNWLKCLYVCRCFGKAHKTTSQRKSEFLVRDLVTIADFLFHYIAAFFIIIASQYLIKRRCEQNDFNISITHFIAYYYCIYIQWKFAFHTCKFCKKCIRSWMCTSCIASHSLDTPGDFYIHTNIIT